MKINTIREKKMLSKTRNEVANQIIRLKKQSRILEHKVRRLSKVDVPCNNCDFDFRFP